MYSLSYRRSVNTIYMTLVIYCYESIVLSSWLAWISKYVTRIYTLQNLLHLTTSSRARASSRTPGEECSQNIGVSLFLICRSDFTSPVCCGDKQDTSSTPPFVCANKIDAKAAYKCLLGCFADPVSLLSSTRPWSVMLVFVRFSRFFRGRCSWHE